MTFAPLIPLWAVIALGILFAGGLLLFARSSLRHLPLRALIAAAALLILANPVQETERRQPTDDVALVLIDGSASMTVEDRARLAAATAERLAESPDGIDWSVETLPSASDTGTALAAPIEDAIANADPGRLGAVFVITDGVAEDAPDTAALPADIPLHTLIAGSRDIDDRRVEVIRAPPFTVAGETAPIQIRVEDDQTGPVPVDIRTSDGQVYRQTVEPNTPVDLGIPVEKRGPLDVALSVPVRDGEATPVNNQALLRLSGISDRLSVLLVSGRPYPGGRVWRDLFKADPNVDLIHFTILRLPTSFDPTPPQDLALIPFPVEELFGERLDAFDLIIFDRFDLTQLMSWAYFENVANRIEEGGSLLVVAGPEYAERGSIYQTPLRRVLAGSPSGDAIGTAFSPALTPVGERHPVTAPFSSEDEPDWGQWERAVGINPGRSEILMETQSVPLLMIDRRGEGRTALLASTDVWHWARAVDGTGPHNELLRRLAHWLMQEPELEEDQLSVTGTPDGLRIEARSMGTLQPARIMGPTGAERSAAFDPDGRAEVPVTEPGLHSVEAAGQVRFALVGASQELAEVQAREAPLAAISSATGGGTFWLQDGVPDVRSVSMTGSASGSGWAGVRQREAGALLSIDRTPILPPWAWLLILAPLIALAWWRERN